MELIKTKNGYRKNNFNKDSKLIIGIFVTFILLTLIFFISSTNDWSQFNFDKLWIILTNIFRFDKVDIPTYGKIISSVFNALLITLVITVLSLMFAFVFAIFSIETIYNKYQTNAIKIFASVIRAVPTVVWVIIFIPIFGLSMSTAIIGMSLHSISFFIKAFSETFEEVDKGTIEALQSVGASKMKIVFGAIVPSSLTKFVGWIAIRFEINLAVVIVIAPIVGVTGNIGYLIYEYYRSLNYAALGVSLGFIVGITLILEKLSYKIKKKVN